jgi:hypothetical protein
MQLLQTLPHFSFPFSFHERIYRIQTGKHPWKWKAILKKTFHGTCQPAACLPKEILEWPTCQPQHPER